MITLQEAVNKVYQWFIVEKHGPSIDYSGTAPTCLYRGPNGCKCNVGVLIPDDAWNEVFRQKNFSLANNEIVDDLIKYYPVFEQYLPSVEYWYKFQRVHDSAARNSNGDKEKFLEYFEKNLAKFCENCGVNYPG